MPPDALREVADFVYFLRRRVVNPQSFVEEQFRLLIEHDLSELNEKQLKHLKAEFADYEKQYLHERVLDNHGL